jgi:arylsulfatase A-like enzyme
LRWSRTIRLLTAFAVLPALSANASQGQVAGRPAPVDRVLLITIDTLRADHVAAYGGPVATPAIDALASEGALVERAFTPIPSTGPAHASLMTGLYPWRHGTLRNAAPLDARIPTLAEAARARGLATAAFVSSFVLHRRFGFHQGFDSYVFEPTERYLWRGRMREGFFARGEATASAAMGWLTEHADGPFFLWVHLFDPHTPYDPPPGFAVPPDDPVDREGKIVPPRVRDFAALDRLNRAYRGEVAYADAQVGRLVERLRLLGRLDETAVIVTSDHGEGLGDHGELEHGSNVFDELVRVPLVIRAPGVPPGRRLRGAAQLEDLAPTIRALIGAEPAAARDGFDLLPWLAGRAEASPRTAVVGRRRPFPGRHDLFFESRWPRKWIGRVDSPGVDFARDRDPGERDPSPGQGMPEQLREALARRPLAAERAQPEADPETRRALEALGYAEP